ncbi:MAG: anaerobic ribonucleoside-triphosphate reductase activating protein [Candidatus Omnitrophota bacterium]|nr:anaerobic ribonucleoside-triphosphate reductase activating protein [Candidatus Omnitrophota bacterium]
MRIGGFQKLTLVDFPGKVAATVFTQGCNFRCGFCHNPELVCPQLFQTPVPVQEVLDHLDRHRGKLQGVVITGGEPTLQKGLSDFIVRIKDMGFAVKLDTNGSHPEILSSLMERHLIDYIAMDVKSSWAKYSRAAGVVCDTQKIRESIDLIMASGLPYQLRTTLVKEFCSSDDLCDIQHLIDGAKHYVLQPFVLSPKMIDPQSARWEQYTPIEIEALKAKFEKV